MAVGDRNWREFVGPADRWDSQAGIQFVTLATFGLRERHKLCDVGCGSLRAGRLFIPYLARGNYYGIEPEAWLVAEGLAHHVGETLKQLRKPTFITGQWDFPITGFGVKFNFILAQSILTHADPDQVRQFLGQASQALAVGGYILATFAEGKDFTGTGWQYPRSVYYSADFMREAGEAAGLHTFNQYHNTVLGLHGNWATWRR